VTYDISELSAFEKNFLAEMTDFPVDLNEAVHMVHFEQPELKTSEKFAYCENTIASLLDKGLIKFVEWTSKKKLLSSKWDKQKQRELSREEIREHLKIIINWYQTIDIEPRKQTSYFFEPTDLGESALDAIFGIDKPS